jgi:hypothetical protein
MIGASAASVDACSSFFTRRFNANMLVTSLPGGFPLRYNPVELASMNQLEGGTMMQSLKRLLMAAGALALAMTMISVVAPRAVRAAVSTLVTVMNTSANPSYSLDADMATRIPYQSENVQNCSGNNGCSFSFTPAPAGHRLVVENVNALLTLASGAGALPAVSLINVAHTIYFGASGNIGETSQGAPVASVNQAVKIYFDPSDGAPLMVVIANFNSGLTTQYASLTGYLIDCAVAGCPTIQR